MFVGPAGGPLRRSNWSKAGGRDGGQLGLDHLHFHDLRHTGNTLAAATGASTKELMSRMGHSSSRAALIYQHATAERELAIAQRLSDMVLSVQNQLGLATEPPSDIDLSNRHRRQGSGLTLVASNVLPLEKGFMLYASTGMTRMPFRAAAITSRS